MHLKQGVFEKNAENHRQKYDRKNHSKKLFVQGFAFRKGSFADKIKNIECRRNYQQKAQQIPRGNGDKGQGINY